MRDLQTVLAAARALLAGGEGAAEPDARTLLAEVIEWASFTPNPSERVQIEAMPGKPDPDRYLALPVALQINPQAAGGIVQTPQGEMVIFQYLMAMPMANLKASVLLGPNGQAANPAEGMLPTIVGRWVLPRGRVATHVLQHMGIEAAPSVDDRGVLGRLRLPVGE